MSEDKRISTEYNLKKVILLGLIVLTLVVSIGISVHLSWLSEIPFLFELSGPEDFESDKIESEQFVNGYRYTATFRHTSVTPLSSDNLSISISIVQDSQLQQFRPRTLSEPGVKYKKYKISATGFFTTDTIEKVDEGKVSIESKEKVQNMTVCLRYNDTILSCSSSSSRAS